jgi:alpha-amylase
MFTCRVSMCKAFTYRARWFGVAAVLLATTASSRARAADQPVAIFHAFHQRFSDIEKFVCALSGQGYSHVQIPPAQKSSNKGPEWFYRYQPVDFRTIEGPGGEGEAELSSLISKAHACNMKVIADVVFNQMTSDPAFSGLDKFPGLDKADFHDRCGAKCGTDCKINYDDGDNDSEISCWLNGDLPDVAQEHDRVRKVQKQHLKKLLDLGIDGFRFDAAKHMKAEYVDEYVDFIDDLSKGNAWNYLEVIPDRGTKLTFYNWIAAVTDFELYNTLTNAFKASGSLKSLRPASAFDDSRSVTFGSNHDTRLHIGSNAATNPINACDTLDSMDCVLAASYVLARENGTPLILNQDNMVPFIPAGVKFRQIMHERAKQNLQTHEYVLGVVDSDTLLIMERGEEGFFVVNKAAERFDALVLDMTLTNLEGCYRELRNNFTIAIQRNTFGKKFVTRWGTWARGGLLIEPREALYFIREPFDQCN